jgi:hypothetical protein
MMADNLDDLGGAFLRGPPDWLAGAQYEIPAGMPLSRLGDAHEIAALRQARAVRPPLGRREGAATRFIEEQYPQTPLDYAMLALGGPLSRGVKIGTLALGGLLTSDEAQAGPAGKILRLGQQAPKGGGLFPGIFKRADVIASEAEARVAAEHPALKELFGVTRQDLSDIGQQGRRPGNILEPKYGGSDIATPGRSYVAEGVITPGNERRLLDALGEAETRAPRLVQGMDAWYVQDPLYQRMVQLVGPEQARRDFPRFNTMTSMASPGSEVLTEINRGTAAYMMAHQGQFPTFLKYGGTAAEKRGADFPPQLRDVVGHAYHSTAQAGPMERYLATGAVDMTSPKVPLYIQAGGVPETGFQTVLPVPDAHWTRAIGAADVRAAHGNTKPGVSMKTPEYRDVGPWFRERIAQPLGIEAVPAQGRLWGLMAPQTGVDTPIGAPKLELLAQRIWERAKQRGIDPKVMRDYVLRGAGHAGFTGAILGGGLNGPVEEP